ncbi:DDE-type integrase/transposase/recombinase [bacterium]|nr:DDE-type integrase/transposase/recombinase [bacterium]
MAKKKIISADAFIKKIYYDPSSPGAFSGLSKLWGHVKTLKDRPKEINKTWVRKWLLKQDTSGVFSRRLVKFPREKIIPYSLDHTWECDLADLTSLKDDNDGFCFLLVVIDTFSKFAWLRALKTKKAIEVRDAMEDIFLSEGRKPVRVRTDLGSEFVARSFKQLLRKNDVYLYHSYSESHSCFVERLIKTIKQKLFMMFYSNQSYKYVDQLQSIAKSYNSTLHSKIKMAPQEVTKENELRVYMDTYMPSVNKMAAVTMAKPNFKYKEGDLVRVSYQRGKFDRSYHETYSEEIFKIKAQIHSVPPRYELEDLLGEAVKGSFYEPELAHAHEDPHRSFKIDKVLGYRKRKNVPREALVRWYGYSEKHDSYIPASHIKKYR